MEAENTGRVAVGIVKAPSVLHEKTATQHLADLYMLRENPELDVCFEDKEIDCIRVDGGSEEGPAHLEVQFRWREWHLKKEKEVTLVTTRNSGASCFNLVELQNGVIGRAHANLFIPSTLTGSAETETGYSEQKHRENMEAAIEVYLSRIQEIPFGPAVIKTCRGATDERACKMKSERNSLLIFLRGSKAEKKLLQASKPELYQYFQKIWAFKEETHGEEPAIRLCFSAESLLSSRPLATTAAGQVQYARKYSKRTKKWHAQPKKVEKDYRYWPIIMANILKGRHDDKGSVRRKLERPATHPKNLAPTIGMRQPVPTEDLVKFRNLRYGNRKKRPK